MTGSIERRERRVIPPSDWVWVGDDRRVRKCGRRKDDGSAEEQEFQRKLDRDMDVMAIIADPTHPDYRETIMACQAELEEKRGMVAEYRAMHQPEYYI